MKCLKPSITTLDTRRAAPVATERIRGWKLQQIRERIALRAEYICQKCRRVTGLKDGELDHITPLHMGGADNDENLQWLCIPCHAEKSAEEENGRVR